MMSAASRNLFARLALALLVALSGVFAPAGRTAEMPDSAGGQFTKTIRPFLAKNCYACHNKSLRTSDFDLMSITSGESLSHDPDLWEKVSHRLQDGTMPPKPIAKPPAADVARVVAWIHEGIERAEQSAVPDPGKVTARRLNRAEYNNTIRDLLGVNFRPADEFPQDDSGYGFDNIGDVLSLSPVLLEKYLKAAESVVSTALNGPAPLKPTVLRSQPPHADFELFPKAQPEYDETGLSLPGALHTTMQFPRTGDYTVRVAIEGRRPQGSEPAQVAVWLDGKQVQTLPMNGPEDRGGIDLFGSQAEFRMRIPAGDHWIAASVYRIYEGLPASYGGPNPTHRPPPPPVDIMRFVKVPSGATPEAVEKLKKDAEVRMAKFRVPANRVWVHWLEATGPYNAAAGPDPNVRKNIFVCGHVGGKHSAACSRVILRSFARRAFRRPVTAAELQPYLQLVSDARRNGATFEEGLGAGLQAILVSPDFLFRIERPAPAAAVSPTGVRRLDTYSLASRLSYFLWSSMPDEELLKCAESGALADAAVLRAQVGRMLKDKRSEALVQNFAGQWLELRRLESLTPDREKFPQFDDYLRMSIRQETEMLFAHLMHQDLSILELIDAPYTFVNEKLAKFYNIPGVKGPEFRRVSLAGTNRGGVLTHASVLTVSSYATRTSPVLRGKWILENILNAPVPPPPPNVPQLDEAKIGTSGSLRQQLEEHRSNPACASCHSKMDPLGLAFENFSAVGEYRTHDGKFPIDSSGVLPDGRSFRGPEELRALLRRDSDKFTECVTEKMLTYALGRGLERFDKRTVRQIARDVAAKEFRFSALVTEIVNSFPFQNTRGDMRSGS